MKSLSCRHFFLQVMFVLLVVYGAFPAPGFSQPKNPGAANLLQEAENLYRAQRYDEALQRYEQYLRTSPPEQQGQYAWLRTAELYGIRGDWNQARNRYERLLTMKIDSSLALRARYGAGQANYKLGNYQEAERILENLSACSLPGELRFKTNALLTELSLQNGNTTQAFSRLLLVEKELPYGEEEWFQDLKIRLLSRANALELEKLADLYRDNPLTAGVLLQLAKLELQAGRPEKVETWLTALQKRFPDTPEAAQAKQWLSTEKNLTKPAAAPTTVGCLVPLSGDNAEFGRQVKNGLELASSQTGVALIIKDVGNSAQKTAAAVEELAANPQVLVLVGFFPSTTADAAAEAAQRLEIPLLALTQKKDITQDRPYVFRDFLTQRLMLQALLHYTANTRGWQRYAILYPNSKYGQSLARQFSEEASGQAAKVVGQASYTEGGKDVAQAVQTLTQINQGQEGAPPLEAIFIPDEANVVAAVAKELAASPLAQVRLLGTNLLQTPATLQYGSLEGILFADGFLAGDAEPTVKAFAADYRQQFQQAPTYLAAQGYSSMRLLAQAHKDSPDRSRKDFAQRLEHLTPPSGFSLFKDFSPEREAELTTKIVTIRGKEFQVEH